MTTVKVPPNKKRKLTPSATATNQSSPIVVDAGTGSDSDIEILHQGPVRPARKTTSTTKNHSNAAAASKKHSPSGNSAPKRAKSRSAISTVATTMSRTPSRQEATNVKKDVNDHDEDEDDDVLVIDDDATPTYDDSSRSSEAAQSPAPVLLPRRQPLFRASPDQEDGTREQDGNDHVPEGVASEDDGDIEVPVVGMGQDGNVFVQGSSKDLAPGAPTRKTNSASTGKGKAKSSPPKSKGKRATPKDIRSTPLQNTDQEGDVAQCPVCSVTLASLPKKQREVHVNVCLDGGDTKAVSTGFFAPISALFRSRPTASPAPAPAREASPGSAQKQPAPVSASSKGKAKADPAPARPASTSKRKSAPGKYQVREPADGKSTDPVAASSSGSTALSSVPGSSKRPLSFLPSLSLPSLPSASPLMPNAFTALMTGNIETKQWKEAEAADKRKGRVAKGEHKAVPFYKWVEGLEITVDAFRYNKIEGCKGYFLSHAHSDHYQNMNSSWHYGPIYCSVTTANLIKLKLGVADEWVKPLPMDQTVKVEGIDVTLIDANHCPGSVVFLFEGPHTDPKSVWSKTPKRIFRYLHCGDFRASPMHINHPAVRGKKMDAVYLDTTYLDAKYCFPAQELVIAAVSQLVKERVLDDDPEALGRVGGEEQVRQVGMMKGWLREGKAKKEEDLDEEEEKNILRARTALIKEEGGNDLDEVKDEVNHHDDSLRDARGDEDGLETPMDLGEQVRVFGEDESEDCQNLEDVNNDEDELGGDVEPVEGDPEEADAFGADDFDNDAKPVIVELEDEELDVKVDLPQDDKNSCLGEHNIKPDTKPETKPDLKPDVKPDLKPDLKPDVKPRFKERFLVLIGTYSIGKERIVKGIAKALQTKIYCDERKLSILQAQDDPELHALITRDPLEAQVHMCWLQEIKHDALADYLGKYHAKHVAGGFTKLIGLRPTGWTYRAENKLNDKTPSIAKIVEREKLRKFSPAGMYPQRDSTSTCLAYGVPYSEHSSFFELTCFALSLDYVKMIPTVNVHTETSRNKMKMWMTRWMDEKKRRADARIPRMVQPRAEAYW